MYLQFHSLPSPYSSVQLYHVSTLLSHFSNGVAREWQVLKIILKGASASLAIGRDSFYFVPECTQSSLLNLPLLLAIRKAL